MSTSKNYSDNIGDRLSFTFSLLLGVPPIKLLNALGVKNSIPTLLHYVDSIGFSLIFKHNHSSTPYVAVAIEDGQVVDCYFVKAGSEPQSNNGRGSLFYIGAVRKNGISVNEYMDKNKSSPFELLLSNTNIKRLSLSLEK